MVSGWHLNGPGHTLGLVYGTGLDRSGWGRLGQVNLRLVGICRRLNGLRVGRFCFGAFCFGAFCWRRVLLVLVVHVLVVLVRVLVVLVVHVLVVLVRVLVVLVLRLRRISGLALWLHRGARDRAGHAGAAELRR